MKEYIMSFFNAPVTNKIPTCICSVAGLHTYISTNPQLEELTRKVRAGLGDKQVFRKNKQTLLPYVTPAGICLLLQRTMHASSFGSLCHRY